MSLPFSPNCVGAALSITGHTVQPACTDMCLRPQLGPTSGVAAHQYWSGHLSNARRARAYRTATSQHQRQDASCEERKRSRGVQCARATMSVLARETSCASARPLHAPMLAIRTRWIVQRLSLICRKCFVTHLTVIAMETTTSWLRCFVLRRERE